MPESRARSLGDDLEGVVRRAITVAGGHAEHRFHAAAGGRDGARSAWRTERKIIPGSDRQPAQQLVVPGRAALRVDLARMMSRAARCAAHYRSASTMQELRDHQQWPRGVLAVTTRLKGWLRRGSSSRPAAGAPGIGLCVIRAKRRLVDAPAVATDPRPRAPRRTELAAEIRRYISASVESHIQSRWRCSVAQARALSRARSGAGRQSSRPMRASSGWRVALRVVHAAARLHHRQRAELCGRPASSGTPARRKRMPSSASAAGCRGSADRARAVGITTIGPSPMIYARSYERAAPRAA